MATSPISQPRRKITDVDHGNTLILGNAATGMSGLWSVQFVPDASWDGALVVVGKQYDTLPADLVQHIPIPYKKIYLNDVVGDYSLVTDTITSMSLIEIPANGLSVAVTVACNAGFGYLYARPLDGPSVSP